MLFNATTESDSIKIEENVVDVPEYCEVETADGWILCKELSVEDKVIVEGCIVVISSIEDHGSIRRLHISDISN